MMEAAPTVTPRSWAICGSSESADRTIAWLAKPATARKTIARLGLGEGGGAGGPFAGHPSGPASFAIRYRHAPIRRPEKHVRHGEDLPARRARRPHLRGLGGGRSVPRRPAGAARGRALLHRHPAAQRHRLA